MLIEEIRRGESETLEFKEFVPTNSRTYMRTVVAFANGRGGRILVGVSNNRKIVGVDNDNVFAQMDALVNAISDSCEPTIIPRVYLETIEQKTIIVLDISSGRQSPYYLKAEGMLKGVYIRVGATTRPASRESVQELILEGMGKGYDEVKASREPISENEITELCQSLTAYAREQCTSAEERAQLKSLTKNQLLSWRLLLEENGQIYPTYGFYLLAGKNTYDLMAQVQCAVFKGLTRGKFVDRKTYTGPLYKQIDEAYAFVLRNLRMGAQIVGLFRHDVCELPEKTLRELIINAICHRSYVQQRCVQIAIYDDRLEVTSPGMLARDVTLDKLRQGYSSLRNRGLAAAFMYMKLIEGWGSGIPKMLQECQEYGLREPELINSDSDFRVNIYRNQPDLLPNKAYAYPVLAQHEIHETTSYYGREENIYLQGSSTLAREKLRQAYGLDEQQAILLFFAKEHGALTTKQAEYLLQVKGRRALQVLHSLVEREMLVKVGAARATIYKFVV